MPTRNDNSTLSEYCNDTLTYTLNIPVPKDTTTVCVDNTCNLPSAEDYEKLDAEYVEDYILATSKKFSEPKYACPICGGGMRRDETVVLCSNPPSYRYECDSCDHIAYHHI